MEGDSGQIRIRRKDRVENGRCGGKVSRQRKREKREERREEDTVANYTYIIYTFQTPRFWSNWHSLPESANVH